MRTKNTVITPLIRDWSHLQKRFQRLFKTSKVHTDIELSQTKKTKKKGHYRKS